MLSMATFSLHIRKDTFQTLAAHLVQVFTLQPLTLNTFQCLNRRLLGLLKKKSYAELLLHSGDSAAVSIRRVFHGMKKTLMSYNARSALARLRFRYTMDVDPYFPIFGEFVLPGNQGSRPFGDLTLARRNCRLKLGMQNLNRSLRRNAWIVHHKIVGSPIRYAVMMHLYFPSHLRLPPEFPGLLVWYWNIYFPVSTRSYLLRSSGFEVESSVILVQLFHRRWIWVG
jgi:hypothetical protein